MDWVWALVVGVAGLIAGFLLFCLCTGGKTTEVDLANYLPGEDDRDALEDVYWHVLDEMGVPHEKLRR